MAKKVLFTFGTRPEVIKLAPVIELAKKCNDLKPIVCATAQHRYLMDQALKEFNIRPDIDLDLMKADQTLYDIVSSVSKNMKIVYRKYNPDLVLVEGDTSTVFAASLAAYYENIDIGHVEAGLRSRDKQNPFPEEVNRRFVSLVAKYNFCPTQHAKANLVKESVDPHSIFVTGNTVIDALEKTLAIIRLKPPIFKEMKPEFFKKPYVLITGHRRENFGKGIKSICMTIRSLAKKHGSLNWLWVAHLNPNVRKVVFQILSGLPNVKIVEPAQYKEFVFLMEHAEFIISDSGGVQEEAPSLKKTVFITRIRTERPEAIESGTSILVGTDPKKINRHVDNLLKTCKPQKIIKNPFGDGKAAKRIIDIITKGYCREFRHYK